MSAIFDELDHTLQTQDADRMTERLCQELREKKDYHGLFYGLLLQKRLALGLPPVQVGSSENLPIEVQRPYEDAIREVARTVGQLYLGEGDIPSAWPFYRMIGEPAPVAEAINKAEADEGEQTQEIVGIALHEGVNPRRGFDLLLKRFGLCTAITTLGQGMQLADEVRQHCVARLVRALYEELRDRLTADIERREGPLSPPLEGGVRRGIVRQLIADRPWLFEDEFYHIDVSHLGAVVQYSMHLQPGEELDLAIELCEYGGKLSPRFQHAGDPPFEDQYRDYGAYLRTLAGQDVEEGIAHFRAKAESADPEQVGSYPAEVLVNLLVRLGKHREAVDSFSRYLAQADARRLSCPGLQELCAKVGDFRPLVEVSLRRGDLVNYAAGLLQSQKPE